MKTRKLLHKCTIGGLLVLLKDTQENISVCCSTPDCMHLFGRNYAIELEVPENDILIEHTDDIDARIQTPWDEVRINFKIDYVKKIIGSKKLQISDNDMVYCARYGVISPSTDTEAKFQIKDLLKDINIIPVRKSGYTKKFLNI